MLKQVALLILIVAVAGGCATTGDSFNLVSTEQEKELGDKIAIEIEKDATVSTDAQLQAYVARIGERLHRVVERRDVDYTFKVIDDPETVNAFALPGGRMYVYTGLMKLCEDEAQLASVMAHEMAHVSAHHHGENLTRQMGVSLVASILLGEQPGALAELAAQFANMGFSNYYSREAEREADYIGVEMLFRAGYKPEAMVTFMQNLVNQKQESGAPEIPAFISTHPATEQRVNYLQQIVASYPLDVRIELPNYRERYEAEVLARLG